MSQFINSPHSLARFETETKRKVIFKMFGTSWKMIMLTWQKGSLVEKTPETSKLTTICLDYENNFNPTCQSEITLNYAIKNKAEAGFQYTLFN